MADFGKGQEDLVALVSGERAMYGKSMWGKKEKDTGVSFCWLPEQTNHLKAQFSEETTSQAKDTSG